MTMAYGKPSHAIVTITTSTSPTTH
jgi:hypothetical protein